MIMAGTARATVQLIKNISKSRSPIREGERIHCYVVKAGFGSNQHVGTALVTFYAIAGSAIAARNLFDEIPQPGLVAWTAMVRAYVVLARPTDALELFRKLRLAGLMPDSVALATAFSACRQLGHSTPGKMIHGLIIKSGIQVDAFVSTELMAVYGEDGELTLVHRVFDEMPVKTTVAWNAIIHQYAMGDCLEDAYAFFRATPNRDVVSWTTMISGFSHAGRCEEALALFHEMELMHCVRPNQHVMCAILSACTKLGALDTATWFHSYIERNNLNSDGSLDHCLIDMFAKCGSLENAARVFNKNPTRSDLYSWTSMICGLAMHGRASDALSFFSRMQGIGVRPDGLTLVGVLNACAHGGLVDEGCRYFHSMEKLYGVVPNMEHYGCLIDLLGRAGRLREAYNLITEMPMAPNEVVWKTLLSACKVHNNVELGEIAAARLIDLNPCDSWARMMLSNMYAVASDWVGVTALRKEMAGVGGGKDAGCSSIEVNNEIEEFHAKESLLCKHN